MSLAAARLQHEIDKLDVRITLMQPFADDPVTATLLDDLYDTRTDAFALMLHYFEQQAPTAYTTATTADEYIAALLPPIQPESKRIDYKAIKARLPLADYVSRFGPIRRVGTNHLAHCPGHDDQRPSLHIYPDDSWYCFVCQKGGDIFHYEALRQGVDRALPIE